MMAIAKQSENFYVFASLVFLQQQWWKEKSLIFIVQVERG